MGFGLIHGTNPERWGLLVASLLIWLGGQAQARVYGKGVQGRLGTWSLAVGPHGITATEGADRQDIPWDAVADTRIAPIRANPLYGGSAAWRPGC